jgi:hypothetical protein
MTPTTPASPSLGADRLSGSKAKGTRHRRKGVSQDAAHDLHRTHCRRRSQQIQHAVLDIPIKAGSFHVADLDELDLPDGVGRSVIERAIKDLARSGLIRRAGPPEPVSAGGRHANFLFTWTLAAELDASEPNTLRRLMDETIASQRDYAEVEAFNEIGEREREDLIKWVKLGRRRASS